MRYVPVSALACLAGILKLAAADEVSTRSFLDKAAVWQADVPGGDHALAVHVAELARKAGYAVTEIGSSTLTNATFLNTNTIALLIVPNAQLLPVESIGPIEHFLRKGGDLLACGVPAWEKPTFNLGGHWMSQAEYDGRLASERPTRFLLDLRNERPELWARHTDNPGSPCVRGRIEQDIPTSAVDGSRHFSAVHVSIGRLTGWDVIEPPARPWGIDSDQTLTCFAAKGTAVTRQLAVEWIETDGSRWIATIDLSPRWRWYALPPSAFKSWQPVADRSKPGDKLRPSKAARFTVGLAFTHTDVGPGPHEYWFAALGTAPNPFGDQAPPASIRVPRFESLAPAYQAFPIRTHVQIVPRLDQVVAAGQTAAGSGPTARPEGEGFSGLHPRPRGCGLMQEREWRWQPLLAAIDPAVAKPATQARQADGGGWRDPKAPTQGAYRGAVAALVVHASGPFAGGAWAVFTPRETEFYRTELASATVTQVLMRMRKGVFLVEGGAEFFTCLPDQEVRTGAVLANLGQLPASGLDLRIGVGHDEQPSFQHWGQRLDLAQGERCKVIKTWRIPPDWPVRGGRVQVQLLEDGRCIDVLEHELTVWLPKESPVFVRANNGGLWLGDKPWRAHGVNYMPSSGIGVNSAHFEHWLGRGAYDPEVIERDLRRIANLGMNAVSAFVYYRDHRTLHLLDFLRRAEQLGLRVNLSLRPGTPMDFRWDEIKAIIQYCCLAANDTVLAYDLAWEPSHYDHAYQQKHYLKAWTGWVIQRYGSIEAAERHWGVRCPSQSEKPARPGESEAANATATRGTIKIIDVPPAGQLTKDGPWRRLVADYRVFLDELVAASYSRARDLVRTVDANHLVSFRMQYAGDPTLNVEHLLPYDFYGLRESVDLWEPEAYGRIGDWDQVKAGHFTAAYARLCNPALPVIWSEMGYNLWDPRKGGPGVDKLEFAGKYYRDFYRMMIESGADGVFFWWFPGGCRVNENSDFGIIEPDGTDRTVTQVIRSHGGRFLAAPKPGAPAYWIEIDREADSRGLPGVYEAVKEEYWRNVTAGVGVGLRWVRQPGAR